MSSPELEPTHPDVFVLRALWSPRARVPSAARIATTVLRCAERCSVPLCKSTQWTLRTTQGHAKSKRLLREPEPVCLHCGALWESWEAVAHIPHERRVGPPRISAEERLYGDVDLQVLARLQREMRASYRSHYWPSRAYFPYCVQFSGARGRGGVRALVRWARERYPRAPFSWRPERGLALIHSGRAEWARRLVRARLIPGGDWWQHDDAHE
jgi:hypothetical protein